MARRRRQTRSRRQTRGRRRRTQRQRGGGNGSIGSNVIKIPTLRDCIDEIRISNYTPEDKLTKLKEQCHLNDSDAQIIIDDDDKMTSLDNLLPNLSSKLDDPPYNSYTRLT